MTIKSAWAYNNGNSTLNQDRATVARLEAERKARHQEALPELEKKRELARGQRYFMDNLRFDALKVGDNLSWFGLPHVVVAKKNQKSIITTTGVKLGKGEVVNSI